MDDRKAAMAAEHMSTGSLVSTGGFLATFGGLVLLCQMPPKREAAAAAAAAPSLAPVKMIKIGGDTAEFGCDPLEDKYRLVDESSYSPYPNNEVRNHDWSTGQHNRRAVC